jgi:predicted DNA-binding transcriptional regulator AlpA
MTNQPTTRSEDDPILNIEEAAEYVHVCVNTLRYYRNQNTGPYSFKIGRRVHYRRSALDAWLESQIARGRGETA